MTRFAKLSATALISTLAASTAFAESPQVSTDTSNEVASETGHTYDTNSPRITNGEAEADMLAAGFSTDKIMALAAAEGEMLKTNEGSEIGVIEDVMYNAQGNPELVIDVLDDASVGADKMVVTIQPGNIMVAENRIILDTTFDELMLKVNAAGSRGSSDRVDVTLF